MTKWNWFWNLLLPANYIWISELLFTESERGRFFPYIVTLLMFALHVAGIFVYSRIKKKGLKWNFINFVILMIALGTNIFFLENYIMAD